MKIEWALDPVSGDITVHCTGLLNTYGKLSNILHW